MRADGLAALAHVRLRHRLRPHYLAWRSPLERGTQCPCSAARQGVADCNVRLSRPFYLQSSGCPILVAPEERLRRLSCRVAWTRAVERGESNVG